MLTLSSSSGDIFNTEDSNPRDTASIDASDFGSLELVDENNASFSLTSTRVAANLDGGPLTIQYGFDDTGANEDGDWDDLRFAVTTPLPGAAVLFLSGLAGVGYASRRLRHRAGTDVTTA